MTRILHVCTNRRLGATGSCAGGGSEALAEELARLVAERGLGWRVAPARCLGQCLHGPNVKAAPGGPMLHGCGAERADELIERLLAEWPAEA